MSNSDKKIEVFFDSDKGKMPELKPPTTEMVIAAGKDLAGLPDIKRALEKLYPAAFDKSVKMSGSGFYDEAKGVVAWLSRDKKTIILPARHNWELSEPDVGTGCARLTPTRK